MKLSTRGRYGLRAMLEIALRESKEPVMGREIAFAQAIPEDYLEQVLTSLRKSGLVRSVRGANGGYSLAFPPEQVTTLEIVEALEGSLLPLECLQKPEVCERSSFCAANELWGEAAQAFREVLRRTTLAALRDRQRARLVTADFRI